MISSISNPKVKKVRRLQVDKRYRASQQQFVVEGTRWIGELASVPALAEDVFYTENWLIQEGHTGLIDRIQCRRHLVTEPVMLAMSATETPPGILAAVAIKPLAIPKIPSLVLIVDGVTNPGNLGTMLRTAAAAGVDAVLLAADSVDIYNPKVVRGSMGALLRVPAQQLSWDDISMLAKSLHIWVASAHGTNIYTAIDWREPAALVIGNEAHGPSKQAHSISAGTVTIPMRDATESLNAAIAAGIILFEALRQRSNA